MKEILVYADWKELNAQNLVGWLRTEVLRGEEVFSFEYSNEWLKNKFSPIIDPDIKFFSGKQYLNSEKSNFGIFQDSSPDRWGRLLMKRREAIKSRDLGIKPKRLFESDYLLGVSDIVRLGGLRFKTEHNGSFLENSENLKTPPITSIRELEQVSLRIEDDGFLSDPSAKKWLNMIVAPGSSLGGARPKASVIDVDGSLWIAKFPSKNDEFDSGMWEYLISKLAIKVGININLTRASIFSQKQHTFLTKRFDREKNKRIHFASAMTLLSHRDGHNYKDGASYLEFVDVLESYGCSPKEDLRELWRRIVFSVGVSNTDDHLRNHGFLLMNKGWKLSPAYDINPNPVGHGLSLNISEHDNSLDFDLCLSVCEYFRWEYQEAKSYINNVKNVISNWNQLATEFKISKTEQVMMEQAFNYS